MPGTVLNAGLLDDFREGKTHSPTAPSNKKKTYTGTNLLEDFRAGKIHSPTAPKNKKNYNGSNLLKDFRAGSVHSPNAKKSNGSKYVPSNSGAASSSKSSPRKKSALKKANVNDSPQGGEGTEYVERDKLFIDEIDLDHMRKVKDGEADPDEEAIREKIRIEKQKFLQRINSNNKED